MKSRTVSVAGVVALVMAVLAVCPCPAMAAPASKEPHACCAGKAGLTVAPDTGSCCADEDRDLVAMSSVTVMAADGWATGVVSSVTAVPVPSLARAAVSPPAAPRVLRI